MTAVMREDPVNILLVDDQPAKLLTYESILGELGENLIKVSSATEALEYLLRNDVAVVLVDVVMPELDGYELAAMIRQHPRFQRTSIIFVSALLLTGDTLALALSLAGLALLLNARVTAAALALALAALAKETYLLVTVAAGAWVWTTGRARQALGVIATAALPLAAWDLWLRLTINAKAQAVENLSWLPLAGIVRSVPVWLAERNPVEIALLAVALVSLTLGVFEVLRSRTRTLLRYALAPWVVLALFAGFAVWSKPNNAARALAFLWPVAVLLAFDRPRSRHIDNPGPRG